MVQPPPPPRCAREKFNTSRQAHLDGVHLSIQRIEAQLDLAEGAAAERLDDHVLVDARGARHVA